MRAWRKDTPIGHPPLASRDRTPFCNGCLRCNDSHVLGEQRHPHAWSTPSAPALETGALGKRDPKDFLWWPTSSHSTSPVQEARVQPRRGPRIPPAATKISVPAKLRAAAGTQHYQANKMNIKKRKVRPSQGDPDAASSEPVGDGAGLHRQNLTGFRVGLSGPPRWDPKGLLL